jgi:tricorn protease
MRHGLVWTIWLLVATIGPADEARLLRFPTCHGETIVFTHAGNLYSVSAKGGVARRLTSHDGQEIFPRFSPDGKWIAFTGQYDGNTEVYVIPSGGGVPKRLTWTATLSRDDVADRMGPNNIVIGWKHDSKTILFRSRMRSFNDFVGSLYTVTIDGSMPEPVPLPRGGFASYSPDDTKLAYNRIFREFRTWKRYRGGMADDIWIHDFQKRTTEAIAPSPASDIIPMWAGTKIYFLSDRDRNSRFNLYSYDLTSRELKQHTFFEEFDCKFPSLGDTAIVFENGGYIYRFDLKTEKTEKVPIRLDDDFPVARGGLRFVGDKVASYEISPDGKRALFSARGDLFTVPATTGPTRNLTRSPGIHDRNPKWSPDGQTIAFISDATGEDEIHIIPQDGSAPSKPITKGGDTYKFELHWSPDGSKILWNDKKGRLQYVDVKSGEVQLVAQSQAFEITDFVWSPDSKWIAYVLPRPQEFALLKLYSLESKQTIQASDGWYGVSRPAFSDDGKYLYFISARDFSPTYGQTEFNHIYQNMQRVYLLTLQKDLPHPFAPKSDEVTLPAGSAEGPKPSEAKKPAEPKPAEAAKSEEKVAAGAKAAEGKSPETKPAAPANTIRIDAEGLADRVVRLPVPPSSYTNLTVVGNLVYYQRPGGLFVFDMNSRRETALGNINGYEISHDKKKMLVSSGGKYAIIDLPRGPINIGDGLKLDGMEVRLDRAAEWKQIFEECWRQMRDFFYDPGMHGVDWTAVKAKYAVLLPHVHHRADLTYVIGEMISELNAGHAYVGGGDVPNVPRIPLGLLGAELSRDPQTRFYRIDRILKGTTWDPTTRSPLADIGVQAQVGEYIVAVNGQPTNDMVNIYESLVNMADRHVTLSLNRKPELPGARTVHILPIPDEAPLYYYEWVQNNIAKVDKMSNGKIGYIHVPDMLQKGLNEFAKHYYPQLGKKALLIDMRGNGGGNVSPMLIERLRREIAMVGIHRNGSPTVIPFGTFVGPKACLINEFSASDGDLFPWQFKHYGLGKLIGKRSWGGVVGIRGSLPLLDGGYLNRPEFSRYSLDGKTWIIEGYGVDPDEVVDNDPAKEWAGEDEQLIYGVKHLLQELKTKEFNLPPVPPYPKR